MTTKKNLKKNIKIEYMMFSIFKFAGILCYIVLGVFILSSKTYAQEYTHYVYMDNLICRKVSPEDIIKNYPISLVVKNLPQFEYYCMENFGNKMENISLKRNDETKECFCYLKSQNASSGYLEINDSISKYMFQHNLDYNNVLIKYLYNGELHFGRDVYDIVNLKREWINDFSLDYNAEQQTITVDVSSRDIALCNEKEIIECRSIKMKPLLRDKIVSDILNMNQINPDLEYLEVTLLVEFKNEMRVYATKRKKNRANYTDSHFLGYEFIDDNLVVVRIIDLYNQLFDYITYDNGPVLQITNSTEIVPTIDENCYYYYSIDSDDGTLTLRETGSADFIGGW